MTKLTPAELTDFVRYNIKPIENQKQKELNKIIQKRNTQKLNIEKKLKNKTAKEIAETFYYGGQQDV